MEQFCQCCAMLLSEENLGTEKDGSSSMDYCRYCYADGRFLFDGTMDEMIEYCVPITVREGFYPD